MGFNDDRRDTALSVRDELGEPATYTPKAGGPVKPTVVVVHRARTIVRPTRNEGGAVNQQLNTVTVFRVGDALDIETTRNGDLITLTGSGEIWMVGTVAEKDEFKTKLFVTPKAA